MMIGIDEVGRGAWAGPMVVAGCYFIENPGFIRGLADSKVLSARQRELLDPQIKSSTLFHIVTIPPSKIDNLGLTQCLREAILEIVEAIPSDAEILLDGKFNFLKGTKYESRTRVEVGADGKYPSVMAASVIAKVERDDVMRSFSVSYPEYGFDKNVGYGTRQHAEALEHYGVTQLHRKSFKPVKALL